MNLEFTKIISAIEAELQPQYRVGAVDWVEKNLDHAWSKALDRFDAALTQAISSFDYTRLVSEGEIYKKTIIDLLNQYKNSQNISNEDAFLESLEMCSSGAG